MNQRLSFGVKAGYGMGMVGECLAMNTFYIFFLLYLTDAVGMAAGIAGTVAMIGTFLGAFTDLIAGTKSDNSKNPNGRRRPFIFKAAIPLGLFAFLVYTDWSAISMSAKPIYFIVVSALFWLALSFVDIPYQSLGSEITEDYTEKTSIRSIANILNYAGMILASSATIMIVSMLSNDGGIADTGAWSKVGLLYGVIILISYWIAAGVTKGKEPVNVSSQETAQEPQAGFVATCMELVKIKAFRYVLLYTILGYGGILLFTSINMYYMYNNLLMTEAQVSLIMFIYCFMVMGASAVLGALKIEKKLLVIVCNAVAGVGFVIAHITGLNIVGMYIMWFLLAMAVSSYFVLIYSMLYDVCDIDEYKSGVGREGAVVSLFYFVGKIMGGIAMLAVGWILQFAHYDPMVLEQSAGTLSGISAGTLLIPGALMLLGAIAIIKYPVNKENNAALREAIAARAEGREYSTEKFEELL